MKRLSQLFLLLLFSFSMSAQIISQYIETSSGSVPKGIEIWNNTLSDLNFATQHLVVEKGTNGATPSSDFTLSTGTLASGKAIVIGTSDMQAITESNGSVFYLKPFTFNGDDALVVKYGGVIIDVVGEPGVDPGSAWSGNGVSTANQNIALKEGIETGDIDGWSDPSERFITISTNNSMNGFGIAPILITGTLFTDNDTLNNLSYTFQHGPSASLTFNLSGTTLTNPVVITPPAHYELSTDDYSFTSNPFILTPSGESLSETPIFVRLTANLEIGSYPDETILITSIGATSIPVICNGRVKYREDMELPNAWINEFHYDNISTDENEFIEIVIEDADWFDLNDYKVSLYNGGNGTVYDSMYVDSFTIGSVVDGYSFFTWHPGSIQNGSPDGITIDYKGEVISLISYEGIFTASNGPATGLLSTEIAKAESSTQTAKGLSLQLIGTGNQYSHFHWNAMSASPGLKNSWQFFGLYAEPVPISYTVIIAVFILAGINFGFQYYRIKPRQKREFQQQ